MCVCICVCVCVWSKLSTTATMYVAWSIFVCNRKSIRWYSRKLLTFFYYFFSLFIPLTWPSHLLILFLCLCRSFFSRHSYLRSHTTRQTRGGPRRAILVFDWTNALEHFFLLNNARVICVVASNRTYARITPLIRSRNICEVVLHCSVYLDFSEAIRLPGSEEPHRHEK